MIGRGIAIVAMCVAVVGCRGENPSSAPKSTAEKAAVPAPSTTLDPKETAIAAKDALFKQLSARLMDAMSSGGPATAIEVCSKEAPRIASRVGEEYGVTIGRTSFKLRNPKNAPPEWAASLIKDHPTEPAFVELPENHTGALLPIRLKVQCLACHGPREQIAENVQAQLSKFYPEDQATGFNEGDLRGWFWVDVPGRVSADDSAPDAKKD